MKRRNFCRYAVFSTACLTGIISKDWALTQSVKSFPKKSHYRWVILYWMPYDNDLARFGEPIIEMLTRSTQQSEIAVIVQSDYWGDSKMRRRLIVNGAIHELKVIGEDSSNVSHFSTYLDWAYQTFEAEHWAVIVVGHGGKINEISPDDHRASQQTNITRTWMRVDQFAHAVSQFNQATDGRVELLFFQNCNKATLEVIYEARNCARYTLASQLLLGAPNYYYEGFLKHLQDPSVKGREAAIAIMSSERPDMYHTLTLVDNQAVKRIPEKLSRIFQPILDSQTPVIKQFDVFTYSYAREQYCDLLVLLNYLLTVNPQGQNELTNFTEFLRSSVITFYKTGGELYGRQSRDSDLKGLCGLSLYLPENEQIPSLYNSLTLYQEVDFISLYQKILPY